MRRKIITLTTDFGLRDSYVAEMKAVILSICTEACIVDISHEVRKFDIRMGAFLLFRAARFFPRGSIHVAVIDPEVGTGRRPIIIETKNFLYVGPDNGILIPSAQRDGIKHIYVIKNQKYMFREVSRTFHGRDIFSPVAAYLAIGVPPSEMGPEIFDPVVPSFAKPSISNGSIEGEIIHVDDFGNLITNIEYNDLKSAGIEEGDYLTVKIGREKLALKLCRAYSEVEVNAPLAIIGSCGLLEISVNQGNASTFFGANVGEKAFIYKKVL
ncbi:MAG: S-adenosyl-l-methionine hydroxide adenosyltransferase family protein [Candidatus Bathyarchaeia archaeon]